MPPTTPNESDLKSFLSACESRPAGDADRCVAPQALHRLGPRHLGTHLRPRRRAAEDRHVFAARAARCAARDQARDREARRVVELRRRATRLAADRRP